MNASEIAAWALDEIKAGRHKIVVGRKPEKLKPRTKPWIPAVATLIALPVLIWLLMPWQATVSLRVRNHRQAAMPNTEIVLRSEKGVNHTCKTDRYGEAEISLPHGNYRIYRLYGDRKIPNPTRLRCNGDMSATVHFNLP